MYHSSKESIVTQLQPFLSFFQFSFLLIIKFFLRCINCYQTLILASTEKEHTSLKIPPPQPTSRTVYPRRGLSALCLVWSARGPLSNSDCLMSGTLSLFIVCRGTNEPVSDHHSLAIWSCVPTPLVVDVELKKEEILKNLEKLDK